MFKIVRNADYLTPAKSEIGNTSKHYIEEVNSNIRKTTNMNQWQNTQEFPTIKPTLTE